MASTPILPLAVWASGTNQNSIPANDNALRIEALNREIISQAVTTQPASPTDGDTYIIAATHTGAQWAGFTPKDITIFKGGTWYAWAPVEGLLVNVAGSLFKYDAGSWTASGGGSGAWGSITGTLSAQTDLASALALKQNRSPNVQAVTSAGTVTPTFSNDIVKITAQAAALLLANPTGTAIDAFGMVIRIKDNGTARAITYGTQYRAVGVTLPTTTVISKTVYFAMIWNAEDSTWDVLAVGQQA